jgi:hypothetical protein
VKYLPTGTNAGYMKGDSFVVFFGQKIVSFAAELGVNLHFMKVSRENHNNFECEKITILVDNIPLKGAFIAEVFAEFKQNKNLSFFSRIVLD